MVVLISAYLPLNFALNRQHKVQLLPKPSGIFNHWIGLLFLFLAEVSPLIFASLWETTASRELFLTFWSLIWTWGWSWYKLINCATNFEF